MSEQMNLVEGLEKEIQRNRELLDIYRSLPANAGAFGALMIDRDIQNAVKALGSGDIVEMLKAYNAMKDNE